METDNMNQDLDNSFENTDLKSNRLIDDADKEEIMKIDHRINILNFEMNELVAKIETAQVNANEVVKRLNDVKKDLIPLERAYFDLKAELETMKVETEEEKNIRLKDKYDELESLKNNIDNLTTEYDSIVIPETIKLPVIKSKFNMEKYDNEVANKDLMKNNKIKLSNMISGKNLSYNNLKDEITNGPSPYDIIYNKCKVAYEEFMKINDVYNTINKELVAIERIISRDQFNGKTKYDEINKLYNIREGLLNKGIFFLSIDPITKKTVVTEYDSEGNKKVLFHDLGEEVYNRNKQFKKLEELELNPPTYIYTVGDMMLEFQRESHKTLLSYEQTNYSNFVESFDPEYNRLHKELIKKEILELKKKIKEIDIKIDSLPKHEWIETDHKALEIEKNKVIDSMSSWTRDIYYNELNKNEIKRKDQLREIENQQFKLNNHHRSSFEKFINSIDSIKNDSYLRNRAVNILNNFNY